MLFFLALCAALAQPQAPPLNRIDPVGRFVVGVQQGTREAFLLENPSAQPGAFEPYRLDAFHSFPVLTLVRPDGTLVAS